jgi:hypothetical protein
MKTQYVHWKLQVFGMLVLSFIFPTQEMWFLFPVYVQLNNILISYLSVLFLFFVVKFLASYIIILLGVQ